MVMDDNGAGFCLVGGKFGVAGSAQLDLQIVMT